MRASEWAGAFLYRVGLGCRCWANLCGNVPRSKDRLSRDFEQDIQRNLDCLEESWANGDEESTEPELSMSSAEPSSGSRFMSLDPCGAESESQQQIAIMDGRLRDLKAKMDLLASEFQDATAEHAELMGSTRHVGGKELEVQPGTQLLGRTEGMACATTSETDSTHEDVDMSEDCSGKKPAKPFRSKTGPMRHLRHSSGCNPDPCGSSAGNSGDLSELCQSSMTDMNMSDGMLYDDELDAGEGDFIMDDEIDGIDVDFPSSALADLPTPRGFLNSGSSHLHVLQREGQSQPVGGAGQPEETECCLAEDPDDHAALDVGNPPFSPLDTLLPHPSQLMDVNGSLDFEDPCTWLSNTTFSRMNGGANESSEPDHLSHIQLRSTHVALVEHANRANRLMNELGQTQLALEDVQSQLDYTTDRMLMYKKTLQDEEAAQAVRTARHKLQLDEATTSKFILFCRLQEAQSKILRLEEENARLRQSKANESADATTTGGLEVVSGRSQENAAESDLTAAWDQEDFHGVEERMSSPQPCSSSSNINSVTVSKGRTDDNNHPLHDALSRAMRRLLDAEARGDRLQRQVEQLNTQLDACQEKTPSPRSEQSDIKQVRAELKRVRNRIRKVESELEASNEVRALQDAEISRLKKEIKSAKRGGSHGKAPRWR